MTPANRNTGLTIHNAREDILDRLGLVWCEFELEGWQKRRDGGPWRVRVELVEEGSRSTPMSRNARHCLLRFAASPLSKSL